MNKGPFRFDQVGSLLRSEKLKEAIRKMNEGIIPVDEYQKIKKRKLKEL